MRWLYGAFEQIRHVLLAAVLADDWGQIDTTALPVKHPSRVRGPDSWTGPNDLVARFGRDAAHGEWFYGFGLALRTDLGSRLVRAWSIVPAAVNERDLVPDLVHGAEYLVGLLNDKGLGGRGFTGSLAQMGIANLVPPTKAERKTMPKWLQKVIAEWRNRIEVTNGEITDTMELARHGAHTFHGLLAGTAAATGDQALKDQGLANLDAYRTSAGQFFEEITAGALPTEAVAGELKVHVESLAGAIDSLSTALIPAS